MIRLALLLVCAVSLSAATAPSVTFNKDVAPILYKNCTNCHRPGEAAPMSLLSYKDARPWAKSIREKVSERVMPPWHADERYGKFENERRLSPREIATIVAWVDGGMPEGAAADVPAAPKYTEGWNIKPDLVVDMGADYAVPEKGVVEYQYFTSPYTFTEDRWIQSLEIRPGSRSVVHHVIVCVQDPKGVETKPEGVQVRLQPIDEPRRERRPRQNANSEVRGDRCGWFLAGIAPGETPTVFPSNAGKLVKAGSKLVFQMHYTTTGTAATDRTSLGLTFSKAAPVYHVQTLPVGNARFAIPAGEANHRVDSAAVFTEDVILWKMFPHMHVRGKSFDYRLVYADGREETILSVPKYDFNWQGSYNLAKPLVIPKGTRLECRAYFDNSTHNRFNPDPKTEVKWGDQTWEEMMIGWIFVSVDRSKQTLISKAD